MCGHGGQGNQTTLEIALQSIIGSEKGPAKQFEEKLLSVKQYLLFRISDRDLTRNVLAWYGTCWRISGTPFNEVRPKP